MPRQKLEDVLSTTRDRILIDLHDSLLTTDNYLVTEDELLEELPNTNSKLIDLALSELIDSGHVEESFSDYSITMSGIEYIDALPDETYTPLRNSLSYVSHESDAEQNNNWSPLPLEKSGSSYSDAIEASENALAEISGSNGYAESEPEERDLIVSSVKSTLKNINEGNTTKDQVIAGLVKPLKYVSEKFANASMGEAAKAAVKALLSWLGLN